jgi:bacillithiol biosynthesis cysteine-adding enzyme BshC
MQKTKISRLNLSYFSPLANKLSYEQESLSHFIQESFSLKAFENQITRKKDFDQDKRLILQTELKNKYKSVELSKKTENAIENLSSENCFTVTTGHQLNIFTGPIYFIYKILHTIKLAEELSANYPNQLFVPIYWMASEDHDFAEINHTNIFNKKISWESDFGGAVGNYPLENFDTIKNEVKAFFANFPEAKIHGLLDKYKGKNLAEATFSFVNELFKEYGLVIVDANSSNLKKEFIPILKKEIESSFSEIQVIETSKKLEELGFKPQIFPRPINLFYLTENERIRIIIENENFQIAGVGTFSKEQIFDLIDSSPEKFSPNVVLRPVYQEFILPNLAYIGGAAEIAYWTQLKGVFDALKLTFPLLKVRNSIQIIDANAQKKLAKLNLRELELFSPLDELKQNFVKNNLKEEIDFSDLESKTNELLQVIERQITNFDTNLLKFAEAEKTKLQNQIESIKQKLIKQQKNAFEQELKQIEDLKSKLFPNNGLQERSENFLNFCPNGDVDSLISNLYEAIEVFENDLIVLKS